MDISTTTSSMNSMAVTESSSRQNSQKTSDKSFSDEISKIENDTDTKEVDSSKEKVDNKSDKSDKSEVAENSEKITKDSDKSSDEKVVHNNQNSDMNNMNFVNKEMSNVLLASVSKNGDSMINQEFELGVEGTIQTLLNANKNLESITRQANSQLKLDYSTIQMDYDDAKFFSDLVKDTDAVMQNVVSELQKGAEVSVQNIEKNVKVSSTLLNLLSEANKTNQPVRIDFDKDISVIIKIDKDGSFSAKFIPGDKAVEQYLRQNMSMLQQRFEEQDLSYKELSYSNHQQRRNRKNNNKENSNE